MAAPEQVNPEPRKDIRSPRFTLGAAEGYPQHSIRARPNGSTVCCGRMTRVDAWTWRMMPLILHVLRYYARNQRVRQSGHQAFALQFSERVVVQVHHATRNRFFDRATKRHGILYTRTPTLDSPDWQKQTRNVNSGESERLGLKKLG